MALPDFEVDNTLAQAGADEFGACFICHGPDAKSGGMAPDLRASATVASDDVFADIVRDGSRLHNGMPAFSEYSDEQLLALRHYIRREAETALD